MRKQENKTWLLKQEENGDFYLYQWTPFIAHKGYLPLTDEQAGPYLELQKQGKNNMSYFEEEPEVKTPPPDIKGFRFNATDDSIPPAIVADDDEDEGEDPAIVSEVTGGEDEEEGFEPDPEELAGPESTQEDLLILELKHVRSLSHKTSLEAHMLGKYNIELPVGRLDVMKATANQMLQDLAKKQKLYLIDGGVAINN